MAAFIQSCCILYDYSLLLLEFILTPSQRGHTNFWLKISNMLNRSIRGRMWYRGSISFSFSGNSSEFHKNLEEMFPR